MGGKTATSTSQTTIPPEVLARYNSINTMAENAASKPYRAFGTQASDFVAQMNQQQNAGINSVNAAAGSYQPYLDAATGATRAGMGSSIDNIQKYISPYLTNVADTTSALMRQSNEQAQSGALGAAASSGAFGGDRAGIAAANLAGQNQLAMGKTMADIYNQGYGQAASLSQADLARQLQGGAQMAGLGAQAQGLGLQGAQSQLAAGTMQQQTEQAGKDAMLQELMREEGFRFQVPQYLANIATGTGVASGTTTTNQLPRNWLGFSSGGGVSGYADGGGVAGPRTYAQQGFGGEGYVPAADLPVGQLMISNPPEDDSREKTNQMFQMFASAMGAKRGGVIGARHGYAPGGAPETPPAGGVAAATVPVEPTTGVAPPVARRPPEPTPPGWDTFKPQVSQRESGGDPNALLNFSNREGGQFAGVKVTNMTVDQAIDFARVGGPYANYTREQVGRVATPMGEFQIVGRTLRQAKEDMGLTGNELMTPELQEQIAQHLYNNYGESPWAASAPRDGLGGANLNTQVSTMGGGPAAGVKPYEDRNFIGKFFHNRDGSMNSNAVMALLGGLAKGAEAQTISPLGGILSGLGGGMETYKELLKQTPEVTKANIENTNALQTAYLRAQQLNGYTGTIEEFAKSQGLQGGPFAGGAGGAGGQSVVSGSEGRTYRGASLDPYGRGLTETISLPGVGEVPAGQVYGYLKNLESEMQSAQALGIQIDPQALADVRARIEAHDGQIQTENGVMTDPTYMEAQLGEAAGVRDAAQTTEIATNVNERLNASREAVRNTDELAKALESLPSTGPITDWIAGVQGIAGQLGLTENVDYATAVQIAGKSIAEQARAAVYDLAGNADTNMVRDLVEQSTPRGTMTPEAIEELLAIRSGAAAYNEAYHQAAADALSADPTANVAEVLRRFTMENKPADFIEEMRPKYRGMFVPSAAAAAGITQGEWVELPDDQRQLFMN